MHVSRREGGTAWRFDGTDHAGILLVRTQAVDGVLQGVSHTERFDDGRADVNSIFQQRLILLDKGIDAHRCRSPYGQDGSAVREGSAHVVRLPAVHFLNGVDVPILCLHLHGGNEDDAYRQDNLFQVKKLCSDTKVGIFLFFLSFFRNNRSKAPWGTFIC